MHRKLRQNSNKSCFPIKLMILEIVNIFYPIKQIEKSPNYTICKYYTMQCDWMADISVSGLICVMIMVGIRLQ